MESDSIKDNKKDDYSPPLLEESDSNTTNELILDDLFDKVATLIRETPVVSSESEISNDEKLQMYGLYKYVTVGPHDASNEVPSMFNMVARAKHQAWAECSQRVETRAEAQLRYVKLAACHDQNVVGRECREMLNQYYSQQEQEQQQKKEEKEEEKHKTQKKTNDSSFSCEQEINDEHQVLETESTNSEKESGVANIWSQQRDSDSYQTSGNSNLAQTMTAIVVPYHQQHQSFLASFLEKRLGIPPLMPRGQLDIDYNDLRFAAHQCLWFRNNHNHSSQIQDDIAQLWKSQAQRQDEEVVVGLSVRSLLDLYLTTKKYPPQSEMIVVPPMNIPGMMDVLMFHGLTIVPVDIAASKENSTMIRVDLEAVKQAVTKKTVAIMIVHPFGMMCTTDSEMQAMRDFSRKQQIDIVEDCAQCYSGFEKGTCYLGSPYADISLFSFGTIKTATALGGGIAILRNTRTANEMNRIQHTSCLYVMQTRVEYLRKIVKAIVIKYVSDRPLLYGCILYLSVCLGFDFDALVQSATRSFAASATFRQGSNMGDDASKRRELMVQIRKRPSTALLSLLHRRLGQHAKTTRHVRARKDRCHKMYRILDSIAPNVIVVVPPSVGHDNNNGNSSSDTKSLYWLYPILVDAPDNVSRILRNKYGYDVPRGTSQLQCVSSYYDADDADDNESVMSCPRTKSLFDKILYLPVSSRTMSLSEMQQLARAIHSATNDGYNDDVGGVCVACGSAKPRPSKLDWNFVIVGIGLLAMLDAWLLAGFCLRIMPLLLLSLVLVVAHALRFCIADFYIDSSKAFAKYNSMLFSKPVYRHKGLEVKPAASSEESSLIDLEPENMTHSQSRRILHMDSLKLRQTPATTHEDRAVFLTGATGFLGSLLLRDLLLHRKTLSISSGVVVLCRPKRNKSARVRIQELLEDPMFSFLSVEEKKSLVLVVEGDVTLPDVGMSPEDVDLVCEKMNISHVFHCAAAVSFTQSLQDAAVSNIASSLNLQSLTKQLKSKTAKYVHISTAFVFGAETGSETKPLGQELYSLHPYDPQELYQSMFETQSCAFAAMNSLGFPNTYTFSKCICEHLLARQDAVDTIIIRPSIVGPAVQEPCEGWAGEKPSTIVAAACLYMSYQWNLWSFGKQRVPFIPVDVASRFILAKAFGGESSRIETPGSSITPSSTQSSDEDDFERISQWSDSSFSSGRRSPPYSSPTNTASAGEGDRYWIYNATWDSSSPQSASFSWVDYAVTVTQLGSVKGYFHRATAYFGLFVTVKLLPRLDLSYELYNRIHCALVQSPIKVTLALFEALGWKPNLIRRLSKLSAFLDLPLLFFPFMNNTFTFASELVAPDDFNAERYMFSCAVAAEGFLARIASKTKTREKRRPNQISKGSILPDDTRQSDNELVNGTSLFVVGGSQHAPFSPDLWWALTQPRGNYFIRFAGWVLIKILRLIAAEITVDASSFAYVARSVDRNGGPHIVLAPTHRSYFDFLILSFVFFALPELGVALPDIAAADDFARIPILGWFARNARAFFLKRGRGSADPALTDKVLVLKNSRGKNDPACIEVFIEGCRSRDRRFVCPKTGFLRCLAETGGDHIVLPITINYEGIPDQKNLVDEAVGGTRSGLSSIGMLSWLKRVLNGKVQIGRIHISAASPVQMESSKQHDFVALAKEVQMAQQATVYVSSYHIEAASVALALKYEIVRKALSRVDCNFWPGNRGCDVCSERNYFPEVPISPSELWTVMLHFGHVLAPLFVISHPKWCRWLSPVQPLAHLETRQETALHAVKEALAENFEAADDAVDAAIQLLLSKGFDQPNEDHTAQVAQEMNSSVPSLLLRAAIGLRLKNSEFSSERDNDDVGTCGLAKDASIALGTFWTQRQPPYRQVTDCSLNVSDESLGYWGYNDSGFILEISREGAKSVMMKGNRYDGICGKRLTKIVPFIEAETQVRVNHVKPGLPMVVHLPQHIACGLDTVDIEALKRVASKVSIGVVDRVRNGFGQSQADCYALRSGSFSGTRIPDAVAWPSSEDEVTQLVSLASTKNWCLIPCGGRTNVTHATQCPTKESDPRPIVSLDTTKLNHILWLNEEDGLAHVECGITGRNLVQELEQRGYTIGHEPDSIEFSTLGGWIATKASGMKRNKYGNIEDIVVSVRVAGSEGILWQSTGSEYSAFGRESRGIDLSSIMVGSEGCFGVFTSAIVRIWPIAECREYASVVFPDFEHGLRFARDVSSLGQNMPASVRLLDNDHFRLGQALHEDGSVIEKVQTQATKLIARLTQRFSSQSMVCATITYEGDKSGVRLQQEAIKGLSSLHGGVLAGSRTGRAGYDLTFVIAYLRDFAMSYYFLSDSFETFAPWSKIQSIITATKQRIRSEHKERCLPGVPFIGCRVTQLYHEGACLYFYFCMNFENVKNPSAVFGEIEHAARSEILENGGSLSHHHGVGKLRAPFLSSMDSSPLKNFHRSLKESVDPKNIFGARNGVYGSPKED